MNRTAEIIRELREISPLLASASRVNVYSVLPEYFDTLLSEILNKVNSSGETEYKFTTSNPYKVDPEYFENLSQTVLEKIRSTAVLPNEISEELSQIAPLLNTISKAHVYRAPEGFFDRLEIVAPVSLKPQAKILSLGRRVTKYAAAAVVTGLIAITAYLFVDKDSLVQKDEQKSMVSQEVKNLKDDEIINFLKTRTSGKVSSAITDKLAPHREIKQQLKEMTDDELQQYLNENQEPGEIEVDI